MQSGAQLEANFPGAERPDYRDSLFRIFSKFSLDDQRVMVRTLVINMFMRGDCSLSVYQPTYALDNLDSAYFSDSTNRDRLSPHALDLAGCGPLLTELFFTTQATPSSRANMIAELILIFMKTQYPDKEIHPKAVFEVRDFVYRLLNDGM